ncbi:hypothetical protein IQ226_16230 [Dolichospermum sp. LEGE 00240]|uniref:hypothetical protein n=1 Tax=Dolichospermum sp. LEGE 00240 TaxID=1828603 RepID=UPI0018812D4E|nr:hypothetical protein [Dolichospermum sp. LEGE 00240]MBE9250656.1 hypothetical protein [Dolichospermum sp. LEGE 00240]MDM3853019.1 hypothetical protein [Aphanizomenon gracile PMC627.10]
MYGNLFFKISLPNQRSPFPKLLKSELLAAALRYPTPTSPKQRSPSPHPKTANCLQQRLAIALPHPKSDRTSPHCKKRTACSSASLLLSHIPKSDRPPHPKTAIAFGKVFKRPLSW